MGILEPTDRQFINEKQSRLPLTLYPCWDVQSGEALVPEPFAAPARALGCFVRELIESLEETQRRGCLRRFAADVGQRKAGFGVIGLAGWCVPDPDVQGMGEEMAGYSAISHCCQRPTYDDWAYYSAHEYNNVSVYYFTPDWEGWEERFARGKVFAAHAA